MDFFQSEQQAKRLLIGIEQSANIIVVTDLEGRIVYVNQAFVKSTGYSKDEVMGKNPNILKSGHQDKAFYKDLWQTISSGEVWEGDLRNRRKDGSCYWEHAFIFPVKDDEDRIIEYMAIKENITEQKEAREDLERLRADLEDQAWGLDKTNNAIKLLYKDLAQKNEELKKLDQLKSDFVSTVSHELRTPLAISMEGISLVLDGLAGDLTDKQKHLLGMSHENLSRLNQIINDLLDISKIESGKLTLVHNCIDMVDLVAGQVESYQLVVKQKNITLDLVASDDSCLVFVDRDKIIQVLSNLLNNAYKFTPQDGNITVNLELKNENIICSIKDTGVGIDKVEQDKLFKKFQQIGRQEGPGMKGTGLGLSICKALVEMHGGSIWVESTEGQGSVFAFSLPCYQKVRAQFDAYFTESLRDASLKDRKSVV